MSTKNNKVILTDKYNKKFIYFPKSYEDHFSYDPGLVSTAVCKSKITFTNGIDGILRYRGYPIEELAEFSNYLEVCYLLIFGYLPSQEEFNNFFNRIYEHIIINEKIINTLQGFKHTAHPMSIMISLLASLSAFYHDKINVNNKEELNTIFYRLIAKIPILASMIYKYSQKLPFVYPETRMPYIKNLMFMMFNKPYQKFKFCPIQVKALDVIFILHADHEQNASTSTVRFTGSSGANPFACIASGIASLWGPSHGGANESVIQMLLQIQSKEKIDYFIKKAKDPNDSFKLFGFGHRVYKNYDPRAKCLRKLLYQLIDKHNFASKKEEQLFDTALELEKKALEDQYFIDRKLYPNIDFYSGIILKILGIPTSMYTAFFAVARSAGWIAHWYEMLLDPETRIVRPKQIYIGNEKQTYIPMENR